MHTLYLHVMIVQLKHQVTLQLKGGFPGKTVNQTIA